MFVLYTFDRVFPPPRGILSSTGWIYLAGDRRPRGGRPLFRDRSIGRLNRRTLTREDVGRADVVPRSTRARGGGGGGEEREDSDQRGFLVAVHERGARGVRFPPDKGTAATPGAEETKGARGKGIKEDRRGRKRIEGGL